MLLHIIFFSKEEPSAETTITQSGTVSDNLIAWEVGTTLTLQGTLEAKNNFPVYTHLLVTSDNIKYGIRTINTVEDLSAYIGKEVIVNGEIDLIIRSLPIIVADEFSFANPEDEEKKEASQT